MRRLRALATVALSTVLIAISFGAASPASAKPGGGSGVTIGTVGGGASTSSWPNEGGGGVGLVCYADTNPSPQWSSSNHTIHWGMKIICNTVRNIYINATLYSVDADGVKHFQDQRVQQAVGTTLATTPGFSSCVDWGGTMGWQIKFIGTADGDPFVPNPAYSSVINLPCRDAV